MYNFYPFNYKRFLIVRGNKAVLKTKGCPMPIELLDNLPEMIKEQFRISHEYMSLGHLCGYVAIPKIKLPWQWWSNYNAAGLSYLSIHGGITYCHTESSNVVLAFLLKWATWLCNKSEIGLMYLARKAKCDELRIKDGLPQMPITIEISQFFRHYVYPFFECIFGNIVVFGFDTAHSGDENNMDLRDHKVVMLMVEQMERQLLDFAKIYPQWLKASREDRVTMIDKIRGGEKFKTQLGFGALVDLLGGGKELGKGGKSEEVKQFKRMWRKGTPGNIKVFLHKLFQRADAKR